MPDTADVPRLPICVICDITRPPTAWTPSARARNAASLRSSQSATDPYDASVEGSTDADPNVMTSPQPPAALRT
jgi:hypothetical protein